MSLFEYFEKHEEQAFVAKALATAVAIILVKNFLPGLVNFLLLVFPVVFLLLIRMHAAATGADPKELLYEHITFLPVMRSESERRAEIKPWVTYGIIFLDVLIFYGFEINVNPELIANHLVFLPQEPNIFNVPLSLFTSMFLHAGGGHLWGNMLFLWVVGSAVERRVGKKTFLGLYLLTGVLGNLVFALMAFLATGQAGHALGASGAIAGIMGIFAVRCYFKSMIFPLPILGIFSLILPISLKIRLNSLVIMALFFLADLSGGLRQMSGGETMVAHWAHLGGMISGMLIAAWLKLGREAAEERHLEEGLKAAEATTGYGGGERSLNIVLERDPENAEALLALARLKTKVTNTPEGRELYEKALPLVAKSRPTEIGTVFTEFYQKYHAIPDDPALVGKLVGLLRQSGQTDLCIDCLEYLVDAESVPAHKREKHLYELASLLEFSGREEAARGFYARFVAEHPASILADKARQKAGGEVYVKPEQPEQTEIRVGVAPLNPCPKCGGEMSRKPAKSGPRQGQLFMVCNRYPGCRTAFPAEADESAAAPVPRPKAPKRYRLVFDGTIELNADPDETREKLATLMRCGRERIEKLFSGRTTVLKRDLKHETAVKIKAAFDRTGAICEIVAEKTPPATAPAAPAVAAAAPQPPTPTAAAAAPSPSAAASFEPAAPASSAQSAEAEFNCPKCGFAQKKGESCVKCGVFFAKLASRMEQDMHSMHARDASPSLSNTHAKRWAMICHLSIFSCLIIPLGNILGPLAIWLWKRNQSEFVDWHGKIALNYQLTLLLFSIGCGTVAAFS
ncbi:MAG: rhomboid family intramembrane serine protease, partial [Desulfuromonadales bacterium]|nr:rhomboid family intramembrane serine protease [Desulfuromonadales bacterium]NIR76604.1 rhomboid family intramembrane serine protease [Candidatus Kutchimonas denitrificans]NIS42891.1 rhomboid family intramembrane serine protease [Desulfuromonadales bacterium]